MGRGLAYQWAGESHGWGGISRRRTVVRERELFPRLTSLVGGGVGLPVGRLVGPSVGERVEVLNVVVSLPPNWPSPSTTKSPFM